ncbi:nitroreductase family protein [Oceanobacillus alkalisoli]|uniref:nitroreductase family protein n=1 Tax=Oceanobacillus alkalisoli TaxID=2925113 RepID=UPI001F119DD0|nr:nitroreductase family protein [Oceanobacillus alkalisoli]MCF3942249.1 nitroreductase family protein [Oceanobacillus alkalisoli]
MNLLRTIKERRSTLSFKSEKIELSTLKEIFTYGSYAPTHYMTEAWRMKLYQGEGKEHLIQAIIESYQRSGMLPTGNSEKTLRSRASIADFLLTIPHHALIYYEIPGDPIRNEEDYSSIAAFIQNSQLAAWEYGIGMLWTITPYMHDEQFIEKIGLERDKHKVVAVLQIGYPDKTTRDKGRTSVEKWMEVIE